jgi:DGQHR domain-containing protein
LFEFSLGGKWLNLLKEIAPDLKRVAVLFNPDTAPYFKFYQPVFDSGGGPLGVQVITLPVVTESDIEPALTEFALSEARRRSAEFNDLRKPGWLPTAIVVNILEKTAERENKKVSKSDLIRVCAAGERYSLILPYEKWSEDWRPTDVPPLEIIDGQHRLWAFEKTADPRFELPVVAFYGLDVSWQAYLFWTINIKPKRINASLAFDLYPLLRAEDWLDRGEGHSVYRETRSQELTEVLWSHPDSPWYDRINMLGERQNPWVTQSAWIRSLMATFIRRWEARRSSMGGLFGSRIQGGVEVLDWSRAQQAAFLLYSWRQLHSAIQESSASWARSLRNRANKDHTPASLGDPAFYGAYSLVKTDQGVRGYLHVVNDLCFIMASNLQLRTYSRQRLPMKALLRSHCGRWLSIEWLPSSGISPRDWLISIGARALCLTSLKRSAGKS